VVNSIGTLARIYGSSSMKFWVEAELNDECWDDIVSLPVQLYDNAVFRSPARAFPPDCHQVEITVTWWRSTQLFLTPCFAL
jgi:hypothetical protein